MKERPHEVILAEVASDHQQSLNVPLVLGLPTKIRAIAQSQRLAKTLAPFQMRVASCETLRHCMLPGTYAADSARPDTAARIAYIL